MVILVSKSGKNVEFPNIENKISEKLKFTDYYRKSECSRLQREI